MSVNPFLPPPSALSVLPKIAFWGINHDSRFSGYSIGTRFLGQCHVLDMSNMPSWHSNMQRMDRKHAFACRKHVIVTWKTCNAYIENMHSHVENMPSWHANMHRDASKTCIRMSKPTVFLLKPFGFFSKSPLKPPIRTTVGPILGPLLTPYDTFHSLSRSLFA